MTMTAIAAPASTTSRRRPASRTLTAGVATLTLGLASAALFGPNLAAGELAMDMSMGMTHYMELLATHQPRNLLVFMAVPVVLAETLAISEIALLFQPGLPAWVRRLNRAAGLLAGPAMLAIFLHLMVNAVVPLTLGGAWRGPADVVAVGFYLAGVVPFAGITLVELGLVGVTERDAQRLRAVFISVFLVVAHIAMIFGMLDPAVLGYVMGHH